MTKLFKKFRKDEEGAVTVDWVVLTAAVVGMSAISFNLLEDASNNLITSASGAVDLENDF